MSEGSKVTAKSIGSCGRLGVVFGIRYQGTGLGLIAIGTPFREFTPPNLKNDVNKLTSKGVPVSRRAAALLNSAKMPVEQFVDSD